ncbi:hypothetical protein [Pseudoalteromonas rubra]|uniref:hypothetical protein n=1 Tax=Pseudoalteromonas rubra TaxID=43658 RepID=UPI000F778467|nr:hypothetical protein [Pseudoalteromonas rubra]
MAWQVNRRWYQFGCILVSVSLSACSYSDAHHVRKGADPKFQDDQVAFRNTYYFRVFDPCDTQQENKVPEFQSLYRFVMTGKASTVANKIQFESGTLKSWEIDPFGANIGFDKATGQFKYVSDKTQRNNQIKANAWAEYQRLLEEYQRLRNQEKGGDSHDPADLITSLNQLMGKQVDDVPSDKLNEVSKLTDEIDKVVDASEQLVSASSGTLHTALKDAINEGAVKVKNAHLRQASDALTQFADKRFRIDILKAYSALLKTQITEAVLLNAGTNWSKLLKDNRTVPQSDFNPAFVEVIKANKHLFEPDAKIDDKPVSSTLYNNYKQARGSLLAQFTIPVPNEDELLRWIAKNITPSEVAELNKLDQETKTQRAQLLIEELMAKIEQEAEAAFPDLAAVLKSIGEEPAVVNFDDQHLSALTATQLRSKLKAMLNQRVNLAVSQVSFSGVPESVFTRLSAAMDEQLKIATSVSPATEQEYGWPAKSEPKSESNEILCNNSGPTERKGFQILGPEGWRTLDQDERLVMAMHSSSEPLTSVLKELSARVIQAKNDQSAGLLPLTQAQLRTTESLRAADQTNPMIELQSDSLKSTQQLCELVAKLTTETLNSGPASDLSSPDLSACKEVTDE